MVTDRMRRFGQLPKLGTVIAPPNEPQMSGSNEPVGIIADSINSFLHNYRSAQAWRGQNEMAAAKREQDAQYGEALGQIVDPILGQAQEQGRFLDMDTSMAASIIRENPELLRNPESLMELFLGPEAEGPEIGTHFEGGRLHRYDKTTGEYYDAQPLDLPAEQPDSPLGDLRAQLAAGEITRDEFTILRRNILFGQTADSTLLGARSEGLLTGHNLVDEMTPEEARAARTTRTLQEEHAPSWASILDDTLTGMSREEMRQAGVNVDLQTSTAEGLLESKYSVEVVTDALTDVQGLIVSNPEAVGATGTLTRIGNAVYAQARNLASLAGIGYDPDLLNPNNYSKTFGATGIASAQLQSALVNTAYGVAVANNAGKGRLSNQDVERALVEITGNRNDPAAMIAVLQDTKQRLADGHTGRVKSLANINIGMDVPGVPVGYVGGANMPPPPETEAPPGVPENEWLWMTPEERALWQ